MAPEELVLFEAKLLLDEQLNLDTQYQNTVHRIISATGRQHLRAELDALHHKLIEDPERRSFWEKIHQIFK
jgi:hypothetical protein